MQSSRFFTRTLMCKDHEALRFRYDAAARSTVGRLEVIDSNYVPFGCIDRDGSVTSNSVRRWLSSRAVPMTRPSAKALAEALSLANTEELMLSGLGQSLSDQYWLKPDGLEADWAHVSLYGKDFSTEVGQALLPHDDSSAVAARVKISGDMALLDSSPDTALNGNLPKRWELVDGKPVLIKSGKREHLVLEPYCEHAVTVLCKKLLSPEEYVEYSLVDGHGPYALSSCPCMVDEDHELVPAVDVIGFTRLGNSSSLYEKYIDVLESHGLRQARVGLERMLVIDHLISNWDRHWGNFGVIVDSETREWVSLAPLFDMGESLWCDRAFSPSLTPYHLEYKMPFLTRPAEQMSRYVRFSNWELDLDLTDTIDDMLDVLAKNPMAVAAPGYLELVESGLMGTARDVRDLASGKTPDLGRTLELVTRQTERCPIVLPASPAKGEPDGDTERDPLL